MPDAHLSDDRLIECDLAVLAGEVVDPPAAEHLADCAACAARFTEWHALLGEVRDQASADTDAVFTPARLNAQREKIALRLERLGQQARVLRFPGRPTSEPRHSVRPAATRWIAAAAAAGLFVGIAAGRLHGPGISGRGTTAALARESSASRAAPAGSASPTLSAPSTDGIEEALFLDELDLAIEQPQTRALLAFDTLTPRVREIGAVVR
jgi:hypothetical protein